MKKILAIISIIGLLGAFAGCGRRTDEGRYWSAPNWTSTGKIVFLEHYCIQKWEQTISGWTQAGGSEEINLYEIDNNGSGLRKVAEIDSSEFEYGPELAPVSTSSAGNWIVLSIEDWRRGEHYPVIYIVKRNGDSLKEVGSGTYPDFSPDASKIVYEKPNQGIWIMNRDGSNDHCIVPDSNAKYPAWSPDDSLIGYMSGYTTYILTLNGDAVKHYPQTHFLDWGPLNSGKILVFYSSGEYVAIDIISQKIDTLPLGVEKWSPTGEYFIGRERDWFIIKKDGTSKWYLKDKIGGE